MKKKAVFICVLMILAIFLFACCGTGNEAEIEKKAEIEDKIIEDKEEEIVVDEIDHRIVFIINKQQFSDNYENNGYFIDNLGNRCFFSTVPKEYVRIENLYEYLEEHIEEYEREPFLEQDQLYKVYKHLLMIDKNAETEEENISVDYGYIYYYGIRQIDEKEEIIFLKESGDFEITVLDKNVDDVLEIIGTDNWVKDIVERSW